ncbi:response regulator [Phenylobacterium deserti]|nr:response regulator [Phenylobacterium deserti]
MAGAIRPQPLIAGAFEVNDLVTHRWQLARSGNRGPQVYDRPTDRPLRVLMADDHPTNRAVIEVILSLIDADLMAVEDGAQALEAFKRGAFDVVLMDLQMPVMDGLTAIRGIRNFEQEALRGRTPVLAVSANAMSEHVAAALEAGADRHIAKPVVPEALLDAISRAVAEAEASGVDLRAHAL